MIIRLNMTQNFGRVFNKDFKMTMVKKRKAEAEEDKPDAMDLVNGMNLVDFVENFVSKG